jgi:hypothetical protein
MYPVSHAHIDGIIRSMCTHILNDAVLEMYTPALPSHHLLCTEMAATRSKRWTPSKIARLTDDELWEEILKHNSSTCTGPGTACLCRKAPLHRIVQLALRKGEKSVLGIPIQEVETKQKLMDASTGKELKHGLYFTAPCGDMSEEEIEALVAKGYKICYLDEEEEKKDKPHV